MSLLDRLLHGHKAKRPLCSRQCQVTKIPSCQTDNLLKRSLPRQPVVQDELCSRPTDLASLAQEKNRIIAMPVDQLPDDIDWRRAQTRKCNHQFILLTPLHKPDQSGFIQLSRFNKLSHAALSFTIVVLSTLADTLADFGNNALDFSASFRRYHCQKFLQDGIRRSPKQFLQRMVRQILPQAHNFSETIVTFGSFNEPRKTHFRKICSGILRQT